MLGLLSGLIQGSTDGWTAAPVATLAAGVIFFAAVAGLLYAVSLFLQRGVGYSPERAAVTGFAPAAVRIVIASVACMNLLTRLSRRLSLAGNFVITKRG